MARTARDLQLDPGCKMPLVSGYTDVLIQPPAANHKPSVVKTAGVKLFRGTSTAAVWKEWLHGGDHASVKSLLYEGKDGKLSLREAVRTMSILSLNWPEIRTFQKQLKPSGIKACQKLRQ